MDIQLSSEGHSPLLGRDERADNLGGHRPVWLLRYLVRDSGQENCMSIAPVGVFAVMRVRVTDEALVGDLEDFLVAAECRVRKIGKVTLDVTMRAPSQDQARRELDVYLKTWQAMHPGTHARIVGEAREEGSN